MIVNYTEEGWQVITQRAHGLLAGQLAFHWKKQDRPERWVETLLSIAEHDDATIELEDDDLINDMGGPVNFKMKDFEKEHSEKLMNQALTKSKYIAVLTARHICFLYEKSEDPEAKAFCESLKKEEAKWLKELNISAEEISATYRLLEWCDAFSLLICQQMIQPEKRKIEISVGPDYQTYQFHQTVAGKLTVEPWPFQEESFNVEFESKTLAKLTFKDAKEFRTSYLKAKTQFHKYIFEKG